MEGGALQAADYAMGTVVTYELSVGAGAGAQAIAAQALRQSRAHLHRADEVLSTWRPDSPINRLRREEITLAQAPPEVAEILWSCADARRLTRGRFDPWSAPGGVDPTGMVRGWALGGALDVLRRAGVTAARINAGSVVASYGCPPAGPPIGRFGPSLDSPAGTPEISPGDGAVAAIATLPPGGRGVGHVVATVTGPDPALAEALAVAVVSAWPHDGLGVVTGIPGYGARIVDRSGRVRATPGFPAVAARPRTASRGSPWAA
jgi:thiamine biosynthesis lipoprotein